MNVTYELKQMLCDIIPISMYISIYTASELNPAYLGYIAIHSEDL
jgi:hypothetical protein